MPITPTAAAVPEIWIPTPQQKPLLSVREVAEILGLGVSTCYAQVAAGYIPSIKLSPRRVAVPTAALRGMLGLDPAGRDGDAA